MPICVSLLRSDSDKGGGGSTFEQVFESQCHRYYPAISKGDIFAQLLDLQRRDATHRLDCKELEQRRHELRVLQRSLAPTTGDSKLVERKTDKIKAEVKLLKALIQADQQRIQADGILLQTDLLRIGNVVDINLHGCESILCKNDTTNSDQSQLPPDQLQHTHQVLDALFCLGGYERIHIEGSSSFCISLTGVGVILARAIVTLAMESFEAPSFPLLLLPDKYPMVSEDTILSYLGYQEQLLRIMPSFLMTSMLHRDKIIWDRELPKGNCVCLTHSHPSSYTTTTQRSPEKRQKKLWYHHPSSKSEQVELLGFTGCTLEESRKLQLEFTHRIVNFFSTLLLDIDSFLGYTTQCHRPPSSSFSSQDMIRKRLEVASALEPSESSRVVIEGYLNGSYVILGSVSNRTDYVTRALKIRLGGIAKRADDVAYVHSVHAICCSSNETLEWVVQNNLLLKNETGECGVGIPDSLAIKMGFDAAVFLPFQRLLEAGREGRKPCVKPLHFSSPCLLEETKARDEKISIPKSPFALQRLPNRDEIRAERHISPFDFLPLR